VLPQTGGVTGAAYTHLDWWADLALNWDDLDAAEGLFCGDDFDGREVDVPWGVNRKHDGVGDVLGFELVELAVGFAGGLLAGGLDEKFGDHAARADFGHPHAGAKQIQPQVLRGEANRALRRAIDW